MTQSQYVILAYAVALPALAVLIAASVAAMHRAERALDDLGRRGE